MSEDQDTVLLRRVVETYLFHPLTPAHSSYKGVFTPRRVSENTGLTEGEALSGLDALASTDARVDRKQYAWCELCAEESIPLAPGSISADSGGLEVFCPHCKELQEVFWDDVSVVFEVFDPRRWDGAVRAAQDKLGRVLEDRGYVAEFARVRAVVHDPLRRERGLPPPPLVLAGPPVLVLGLSLEMHEEPPVTVLHRLAPALLHRHRRLATYARAKGLVPLGFWAIFDRDVYGDLPGLASSGQLEVVVGTFAYTVALHPEGRIWMITGDNGHLPSLAELALRKFCETRGGHVQEHMGISIEQNTWAGWTARWQKE